MEIRGKMKYVELSRTRNGDPDYALVGSVWYELMLTFNFHHKEWSMNKQNCE